MGNTYYSKPFSEARLVLYLSGLLYLLSLSQKFCFSGDAPEFVGNYIISCVFCFVQICSEIHVKPKTSCFE